MIPNKIKAVFEFVDFLHSKTSEFAKYIPTVDECLKINQEMYGLNPNNNFQERKKYNVLNEKKNQKFTEVKTGVIDLIQNEALNLNICQETNFGLEFNWGRSEIHELKKQATDIDEKTIIEHKNRYLEFRNETNSYFLSFQYFFFALDRHLKEIFVYFDKKAESDFARLEPIGNSSEPVFSKDEIQIISRGLNLIGFFEIRNIVKTYDEDYGKDIDTNRPIILNLENWNKFKDDFVKQRFENETNKDLTKKEIIIFELKALNELEKYIESNESKLTLENKKTYTILIMRYRVILQTLQPLKSQQAEKPNLELPENKKPKFIAKEYALAFIFDLYADGKQIPINRVEGSYDAKELKRIGKQEKRFDKPDTFYRAVKDVLKYDLNKAKDLHSISKDWYNAVKTLSTNWVLLKQYLKDKKLIKD